MFIVVMYFCFGVFGLFYC